MFRWIKMQTRQTSIRLLALPGSPASSSCHPLYSDFSVTRVEPHGAMLLAGIFVGLQIRVFVCICCFLYILVAHTVKRLPHGSIPGSERSPGKGNGNPLQYSPPPQQKRRAWGSKKYLASLVAQLVKNLPAMRKTEVRSPGQEDPLEKDMATHSSTLAWRIPRTAEWDRLQSTKSQRVRYDHNQVSLDFPGGSDGKASRVQSLGREDLLEKEMANHSSILAWKIPWTVEPGTLQSKGSQSDTTERLHFHFLYQV